MRLNVKCILEILIYLVQNFFAFLILCLRMVLEGLKNLDYCFSKLFLILSNLLFLTSVIENGINQVVSEFIFFCCVHLFHWFESILFCLNLLWNNFNYLIVVRTFFQIALFFYVTFEFFGDGSQLFNVGDSKWGNLRLENVNEFNSPVWYFASYIHERQYWFHVLCEINIWSFPSNW